MFQRGFYIMNFILLLCTGLELQILQIFKKKVPVQMIIAAIPMDVLIIAMYHWLQKYKTQLAFCIFIISVYSNIMKFEWLQDRRTPLPTPSTPPPPPNELQSISSLFTLVHSWRGSVNMTRRVANLLHPVRLHNFNLFLPSGCWLEENIYKRRQVLVHLPLGGTVSYSWDDELQVRGMG